MEKSAKKASRWVKNLLAYILRVRAKTIFDEVRLLVAPLNFLLHGGKYGVLGFYIPGSRSLTIRTWDNLIFKIRPGTTDLGHTTLIPELYELTRWFLPNAQGIVIDVGANVGGYTTRACRTAELVVAIEPLPDVFKILKQHVLSNCFKNNVVLIQKAISNNDGYAELKVPRLSRYVASGYASLFRDSDIVYRVKTTTLDNIVKSLKIKRINLLKIDIEGAEALAFEGMQETLKITDNLIIEIQPNNKWLIDKLKKLGFTLLDQREINFFFSRTKSTSVKS